MVDTLRVLVSWQCNLRCSYCCNEQEQFRKDIHPTPIDLVPWGQYSNFCISGGEPLLNWRTVRRVCGLIPLGRLVILYTNGILLGETVARECVTLGISAINVGLHEPATYNRLIRSVTRDTKGLPLSVRFHAQDVYERQLTTEFPNTSFRFWKMNDCDRANEHRIVLV